MPDVDVSSLCQGYGRSLGCGMCVWSFFLTHSNGLFDGIRMSDWAPSRAASKMTPGLYVDPHFVRSHVRCGASGRAATRTIRV